MGIFCAFTGCGWITETKKKKYTLARFQIDRVFLVTVVSVWVPSYSFSFGVFSTLYVWMIVLVCLGGESSWSKTHVHVTDFKKPCIIIISQTWETRYILVLWLSMICLIPFDLALFDGNIPSEDGLARIPVMDRILKVAKVSVIHFVIEKDFILLMLL